MSVLPPIATRGEKRLMFQIVYLVGPTSSCMHHHDVPMACQSKTPEKKKGKRKREKRRFPIFDNCSPSESQ